MNSFFQFKTLFIVLGFALFLPIALQGQKNIPYPKYWTYFDSLSSFFNKGDFTNVLRLANYIDNPSSEKSSIYFYFQAALKTKDEALANKLAIRYSHLGMFDLGYLQSTFKENGIALFPKTIKKVKKNGVKYSTSPLKLFLDELKPVKQADQGWRNDKHYYQERKIRDKCKNNPDSCDNSDFRRARTYLDSIHIADSTNIMRFYGLIVKYGFKEMCKVAYGEFGTLIIHSADYKVYHLLEPLYLQGVKDKLLHPALYAHYVDRHHLNFYGHSIYNWWPKDKKEKPSKEKIEEYNQKRKELGLPNWPITMIGYSI